MFCPDDRDSDWRVEFEKIRTRSYDIAYCSYLYRQLDGQAAYPPQSRLEDLGLNPAGGRVGALVLDMCNKLNYPGLPLRNNHGGRRASIGFATGGARMVNNVNDQLTLREADVMVVFTRLDEILENADTLSQ